MNRTLTLSVDTAGQLIFLPGGEWTNAEMAMLCQRAALFFTSQMAAPQAPADGESETEESD